MKTSKPYFLFCLEMEPHYVALTGLELAAQTKVELRVTASVSACAPINLSLSLPFLHLEAQSLRAELLLCYTARQIHNRCVVGIPG